MIKVITSIEKLWQPDKYQYIYQDKWFIYKVLAIDDIGMSYNYSLIDKAKDGRRKERERERATSSVDKKYKMKAHWGVVVGLRM